MKFRPGNVNVTISNGLMWLTACAAAASYSAYAVYEDPALLFIAILCTFSFLNVGINFVQETIQGDKQ